MSHKDDYTVIVFFKDVKPKSWKYVHKLNGFKNFLDSKHREWTYLNVYERRTRKYLKRFYPGDFFPEFLSFVLIMANIFEIFESVIFGQKRAN